MFRDKEHYYKIEAILQEDVTILNLNVITNIGPKYRKEKSTTQQINGHSGKS